MQAMNANLTAEFNFTDPLSEWPQCKPPPQRAVPFSFPAHINFGSSSSDNIDYA